MVHLCEVYCRVAAISCGPPFYGLLLYLRPRPHASLEVAVHQCHEYSEHAVMEGYFMVEAHSPVQAVPQMAVGLETYVRNLVEMDTWFCFETGMGYSLLLPQRCGFSSCVPDHVAWYSVEVSLYESAKAEFSWQPDHGGHDKLAVKLTPHWQPQPDTMYVTEVSNPACDYASKQGTLHRQQSIWKQAQQEKEGVAAASATPAAPAGGADPAPAPPPDSDEMFKQKYCHLRDQATRRSIAVLTSTLRMAATFCGSISLPLSLPRASTAAAPAAGGAWGRRTSRPLKLLLHTTDGAYGSASLP